MPHIRTVVLSVLALASVLGFRASGQSIISTHSGVIYFFAGSVFLEGEPLEQKFGRFPDIGEGCELRTALGRAEILLTPGVFLRLDQSSSIRMLSNRFSDTRVELVGGSVIVEATERTPNTAVQLIYKNWRFQVQGEGAYRIDTLPPRLRAYKGEVRVVVDSEKATITVRQGEVLPLAEVLVPEPSKTFGNDDFKVWAMSRSQTISADNSVAAGIVDDPSQTDSSNAMPAGYSYFPSTVIPSLNIGSPYGLSFWTPYQSMISAIYFPPDLLYRPMHWPSGAPRGTQPYPRQTVIPSPIGIHPRPTAPPITAPPRIPLPSPRPIAFPTAAPPRISSTSPHLPTSSSPSHHIVVGGAHR